MPSFIIPLILGVLFLSQHGQLPDFILGLNIWISPTIPGELHVGFHGVFSIPLESAELLDGVSQCLYMSEGSVHLYF
jgi:hypothetical protein